MDTAFVPHTQEQLKVLKLQVGMPCFIAYVNKDYFNGEESVEKGKATVVITDGNIYFNAVDPYGMDRLVMQARFLGPA